MDLFEIRPRKDASFFARHVSLWKRCGLGGYWVSICDGRVVDFYETHEQAVECSARVCRGEKFAIKCVPRDYAVPRRTFTGLPAGASPDQ